MSARQELVPGGWIEGGRIGASSAGGTRAHRQEGPQVLPWIAGGEMEPHLAGYLPPAHAELRRQCGAGCQPAMPGPHRMPAYHLTACPWGVPQSETRVWARRTVTTYVKWCVFSEPAPSSASPESSTRDSPSRSSEACPAHPSLSESASPTCRSRRKRPSSASG